MKPFRLIAVFLLMLSCAVSAFAEESAEAVLNRFLAEVQEYDQETNFLTTWSLDDQEKMLQIMHEHGIERREYEWAVPENALSDVFAYFYGGERGWSYVQWHQWDVARVALGISREVYYILPDEDMLSEQEALELIEQKVSDTARNGKTPGAEEYLNNPQVAVTAAHILLDGEKVWWFRFYQEEARVGSLCPFGRACPYRI